MATTVGLPVIDTAAVSARYREAAGRPEERRLLVTDFRGSQQEQDLTDPTNCDGLGRVRHFKRSTSSGWPLNPLPIDPASRFLGLAPDDMLRAQVFQNAVCNWRCWYCFVPFNLLSAHPKHSRWVTAEELVDLYLAEPGRPQVIDLSGGQPDLVPEWIPWTMRAMRDRGLEGSVYLWSDDNLSNDYFWQYLGDADLELIRTFRGYGRVGCFKGFDAESFAFNTAADPALFDQQFELFHRLIDLGLDVYAYATLTAPSADGIAGRVARFVDRLQSVSPLLPLRVVPLEVQVFTPVESRLSPVRRESLVHQRRAVEAWMQELENRFPAELRGLSITDIAL
ncbi:dihydropteroate synthase : Putative Fe-S oxidoreductase OS=Candidatus Nitrososphaera evergladensis SR1 GN=NTE_03355 PE=4 SV=1 [Gemmata massiliana]|uniref:Dihydropteroate synthase: Putative Fe-S oxidoreductase n=1 Tax=Gemmata massiliana TaxID=1210884 RepID=A0A6P2CWP6_9BACT|nr:hypothetical protein [Gemmata massiliana]VTR93369.1 dihydropteroate synthase : Putative Fe-S oxidoreductase OS=Candidatus Nitrososphaera evergladensis SR1 GN=NTE_03355 PE=4 SV=1 [Gemmata massiliana]